MKPPHSLLPRRMLLRSLVATSIALASTSASRAQLPLQVGDLVATYCPDLVPLSGGGFGPDPDGFCVKVVRNPLGGTLGTNWLAPLFSNELPVTADTWSIANLGPVFGCCLDEAGNIYVTASTVYGNFPSSWGPGGAGGVYKINGTTGAITVLAMLPNSGVGLGDVCFDRFHEQLFVTNFEDGCIYRLNRNTGATLQVYDPWIADAGVIADPGFAPLGERLWAVHMPEVSHWGGRGLFFSAWLCDRLRPSPAWPASWPTPAPAVPNNTIFLVKVKSDGSIDTMTAPKVSLVMPTIAPGYSHPVSDITYNVRRLHLAERTMSGDYGQLGVAHESRVLRYLTSSPPVPIGPALLVGDFGGSGTNSAGGIAIDTDLTVASPPVGNVWATGDALHFAPNDYIYGLQLLPSTGNGSCAPFSLCTNLIDLDNNVALVDKAQPGDVEYVAAAPVVFDPNQPFPYCGGDVFALCPCDNFGDPGSGCANSLNPAGALLALSGDPMTDDVVLAGSGMPNSTCIYLQGSDDTDEVFGDGVRCAGGSLVRLRTKLNTAGASQFPDGTDTVTLSQRGGVVPGSGAERSYQTYYRNAASFCTPATFNVTNAWHVVW